MFYTMEWIVKGSRLKLVDAHNDTGFSIVGSEDADDSNGKGWAVEGSGQWLPRSFYGTIADRIPSKDTAKRVCLLVYRHYRVSQTIAWIPRLVNSGNPALVDQVADKMSGILWDASRQINKLKQDPNFEHPNIPVMNATYFEEIERPKDSSFIITQNLEGESK